MEELKQGQGLVNYNEYQMQYKERILYIVLAAAILFVVGYIFYKNIIFSLLLCSMAYFYPKIRIREIIEKRKWELNMQFKEMLYYLSTALTAGKSVEGAFLSVLKSLKGVFPDPDTFIIKEVEIILRRLEMNETIEKSLMDFAKRSHLEDIESFADVFKTCNRTGGNLVEVIKNTSTMIKDKIEIKQEIENMVASKKLEQKILTIAPIGMIFFLSVTGKEFMEPVFTTLIGRSVMTLAIGLISTGYFVSKKIMDINI